MQILQITATKHINIMENLQSVITVKTTPQSSHLYPKDPNSSVEGVQVSLSIA